MNPEERRCIGAHYTSEKNILKLIKPLFLDELREEFGQYFVRLPLKKSAKIINGNALRIGWEDVVPKNELSYILGNPPLVMDKIKGAKDFRLSSNKERTKKWADYPTLFSEDRQPTTDFLVEIVNIHLEQQEINNFEHRFEYITTILDDSIQISNPMKYARK